MPLSNVQIYLTKTSHIHVAGKKGIGSDFQILTDFGASDTPMIDITVPKNTIKADIDLEVYNVSHSWEREETEPSVTLPLKVTVTERDQMPDVSSGEKSWQIQLNYFPTADAPYEPQQIQITIRVSEKVSLNPFQQFIQNLGFASPTPTADVTIAYEATVTLIDDMEIMALALGIWTEARDNPVEATRREEMIRVGGVILNRANTNYRDQDTVIGAVLDPFQYSHFNISTNPELWPLNQERYKRFLIL